MYHIALILLIVGVVIEFRDKKTPMKYFYGVFLFLTLMLSLRYGQGTDYFAYRLMYDSAPENFFGLFTDYGFRAEYGWRILGWVLRLFGMPFPAFVFLLSIVQMSMLFLFVQKFCKRRMLALLLSYHTLYLTWFFSALRQGLVMALFLGLLLDWIIQKKYIHYCAGCVVCAMFHSVAWLLLVVPVIHLGLLSTLKRQLIAVAAAWCMGIIIASGIFDSFLPKLLPASVAIYYSRKGLSFFAIMERLLSYGVTVYVYWMSGYSGKHQKGRIAQLMQVVTLGMVVYGGFMWLPLVASRLAVLFKIVEIAILSSVLINRQLVAKLKVAFCLCLTLIMYGKNIAIYLVEGQYNDHVNILNYPYVSVFDPDEISDYRTMDEKYGPLASVFDE